MTYMVGQQNASVCPSQSLQQSPSDRGLAAHLDGARLLNAVAATGVPAREHARGWDSAWIDLSKGLGCPMGGVRCGSRAFVEAAWR